MNKKIIIGIMTVVIIALMVFIIYKINFTKETNVEEVTSSSYDSNKEKEGIYDEYYAELETKKEAFKKVYASYYGEEELNELLDNMSEETNNYMKNNPGKYVFPESGKILIKNCIKIINETDSKEEKEALINIIREMDFSKLDDEDLLRKINEILPD